MGERLTGKGRHAVIWRIKKLFAREFAAAKVRIRSMQVRYVEEKDPIRQALLEIYVSVVHGTPYNEFDTH